jgi:hypothetical protein
MPLVASVNYPDKRIFLSADSVGVDLDTIAVYREVRALRAVTEAHQNFDPIIEAGGNITKIPGVSATPAYARLLHGCRIVPYNVSHSIRLIRDTFTDDGLAGRDCFDRTPLSASVAVDIDVDIAEVEIRYVTTGGGVVLTQSQADKLMSLPSSTAIREAVWSADEALALADKINISAAILRNKTVTDPATGLMTVYADDGVTPLLTAQLWENASGPQKYRGQGSERRDRLA